MIAHKPDYYVGGIYVEDEGVWKGNFIATSDELFNYAEHSVYTIVEYELVLGLIHTQQIYEIWWEKVQKRYN